MNHDPAQKTIIPARIQPRDGRDAVISALVGLFQTAVMFVLPAVAAYLMTSSAGIACVTFAGAYALFLTFSVTRISISSLGIQFHRLFGSPRFLPWDYILSIEEAPRGELIRHGWLWPLFPAREMTPSLSSLHHYRIRWEGGYCYYPPANPELFESHVKAHFKPR